MPQPFQHVFFDCDSTLTRIEGIDELVRTRSLNIQTEVRALTEKAMNGEISITEIYEKRLRLIQPTRDEVNALGKKYIENITPGAKNVVKKLISLGKNVGIISGGILDPICVFAKHLGIELENVHAVTVFFDRNGYYTDFEKSNPLTTGNGKTKLIQSLELEPGRIAFVGDGMTDLEVQGNGVDLFIGFGGVITRPQVKKEAQAWIDNTNLESLFDLILTPEERQPS
jgi:phosphoserine phosphatase